MFTRRCWSFWLQRLGTTLTVRLHTVERHVKPEFVVGRKTKIWHKVLTAFADAGVESIAYCGSKYALSSARCRFEAEIPDDIPREDICQPCLSEVWATRPAKR